MRGEVRGTAPSGPGNRARGQQPLVLQLAAEGEPGGLAPIAADRQRAQVTEGQHQGARRRRPGQRGVGQGRGLWPVRAPDRVADGMLGQQAAQGATHQAPVGTEGHQVAGVVVQQHQRRPPAAAALTREMGQDAALAEPTDGALQVQRAALVGVAEHPAQPRRQLGPGGQRLQARRVPGGAVPAGVGCDGGRRGVGIVGQGLPVHGLPEQRGGEACRRGLLPVSGGLAGRFGGRLPFTGDRIRPLAGLRAPQPEPGGDEAGDVRIARGQPIEQVGPAQGRARWAVHTVDVPASLSSAGVRTRAVRTASGCFLSTKVATSAIRAC